MTVIPALRRELELHEFKATLVYKASSRPARATEVDPVSKTRIKHMDAQLLMHTHRHAPASTPYIYQESK